MPQRSRATRRPCWLAGAALITAAAAACHQAPPKTAPAAKSAAAPSQVARLAAARHADSLNRARTARLAAAARAKATADSIRDAADLQRDAAARARAVIADRVQFAFDSSALRLPEQHMLDEKTKLLKANPAVRLRIDGNADERGSDEYNMALGMRRAASAQHYLIEHGVDSTRIDVTSSGEANPLCREHGEWCWSRNRRDDFLIVAGGDQIKPGR